MEIIIGSIPPLRHNEVQVPAQVSGPVEAKLLHVRPPRKGIAGPSGQERREKKGQDPLTGRVLTVMVPDARTLPADIDQANYRVVMRFQKI